MTDGELVRRVVAGETAAYGELARRWSARVMALCRARLFSAQCHDAEDLTQDVFVRAFVNLGSLSAPEHFGSWLRGIAIHLCADWGRNRQRQRAAFGNQTQPFDSTPVAGTEAEVSDHDERLFVLQQIETIPEDLREVILLRYYDDLTYDDMASWLGVSRATVIERLAKARALLRIRLAKLRSDI